MLTFGQLIGVIVFVISLLVLWKIRVVILLIFAAVTFATVINRVVRRLQRSRVNRGVAITLTVGIILATAALFFVLIFPTIFDQLRELVDRLPKAFRQLLEWYEWLQNFLPGQLLEDIESIDNLVEKIPDIGLNWLGGFLTVFSDSIDFLLNLLLVIVLIVMLLANPSLYRQMFILVFPAFYRRRIEEILQECEKNLVGWAMGRIFNMVFIGMVSALGLWALGVPLPLANGLISALATYVPNIGPVVGSIPPIALAFLDAPWKGFAVIIFYFLIEQLEGLVLTPMVMEHEVSLPPAITLISVLVFSTFFGWLGLFLALPIMAVLQVLLQEVLVNDIMNDWTRDRSDRHKKDSSATEGRSQNQGELPSDVS